MEILIVPPEQTRPTAPLQQRLLRKHLHHNHQPSRSLPAIICSRSLVRFAGVHYGRVIITDFFRRVKAELVVVPKTRSIAEPESAFPWTTCAMEISTAWMELTKPTVRLRLPSRLRHLLSCARKATLGAQLRQGACRGQHCAAPSENV